MNSLKNINYIIREIVYETGKQEIICMTRQEYAGFLRRKGIKKTIISNKKLFLFSIQLKNLIR